MCGLIGLYCYVRKGGWGVSAYIVCRLIGLYSKGGCCLWAKGCTAMLRRVAGV